MAKSTAQPSNYPMGGGREAVSYYSVYLQPNPAAIPKIYKFAGGLRLMVRSKFKFQLQLFEFVLYRCL